MGALKQKQHRAKVQIAEAVRQIGFEFVKRLKEYAAIQKEKGIGDGIVVRGITLSKLVTEFDYGEAYKQLSSHYREKVPQPHTCAAIEGLIEIDDSVRPYAYRIIDQQHFKPRPYQTDIIEAVNMTKGSVLVELPTGGGKSIIAKEIIQHETEQGGVVLIVAPKITLLDQLAATFADLHPQIIHGVKDYDSGHNVFVSTLQTAHKRKLGFTPSMIVIDEVHFGFTGKMIKQLLDSFKGKVIGLSATPYDKQGKPLEGFTTHLNQYNLDYMISNGYLVPVISYQPVKVDLKGIRTVAGDYSAQDLEQRFNTIESVMQVVDATKAKIAERKQAIVFCITIKHSEAMAKAYQDAGISAMAIHSQMPKEQQAQILEEFKSQKIKILTSVEMMTTGFNHPPADTIVLARATKSQNLYKQMVGRVLRLAAGKSEAVLLDCAGVISDLGLPTRPIQPRGKSEQEDKGKSKCPNCDSPRVYRTIKEYTAYRVCAECGHSEEIESQTGYECEACGMIHGNNAEFIAHSGKLHLSCTCGHYTVISEATRHEELKAIFDAKLVETLKRRVVAAYCSWLIGNHGTDFLFSDEVKRQIEAVNIAVEKYPEQAPGVTVEKIEKKIASNPFSDWRLLSVKDEEKLLPAQSQTESSCTKSANDITTVFYNARGFDHAVESLNTLLQSQGKPPLKDWVVKKTKEQIRQSKVQGIEAMTVKRLMNLYSNKKDCNSIDTFVPYVERDRGYIK